MENYYEVLNLINFADIELVKSSYKTLSKKYHPDLNKNIDPNKMIQINKAYEILGDVDKKNKYDAELKLFLRRTESSEANNNRNNETEFDTTVNIKNSSSNIFRVLLSIVIGSIISLIGGFILLALVPVDGSWSFIFYLIYGSILGEIISNISKSKSYYLAIVATLISIFGMVFPYYSYLYDVMPTVYGEMNSIGMLILSTKNILEVFFSNGIVRMLFVVLTPCATFYSILEKEI